MDKLILTHKQVTEAADKLYAQWRWKMAVPGEPKVYVYGVPRGGIPVAYLLSCFGEVVDKPEDANLIVDDIVDSGETRGRYTNTYPTTLFMDLARYLPEGLRQPGQWVVFPWEVGEDDKDTSADDIVIRLLQYIGEDPKREGLLETPKRVLKAWKDWTSGYGGLGESPGEILKTFEDGAEGYDNMIVQKDLPFYSHCEHHLAPFFGTATIAYIPAQKIVGLSKLKRVLDIYSKRLQVQERLTTQIADAVHEHLVPKGVGVVIKARHLCMESRGVACQGQVTVTSALKGEFLTDHKVRDEFLALAR
jgi:GTP cyclohydrolase I